MKLKYMDIGLVIMAGIVFTAWLFATDQNVNN
jgi:hypothetical protein